MTPQIQHTLTRDAIARTYETIRRHMRRTPVLDIEAADFGLAPGRVSLKLELMQHTGSFKARGAFTNLLTRAVPAAGVVAASGGNHGAAVAFAARQLGKPATIFVPTVSSPAKIERIQGYGAHCVITGERYDEALAASRVWAAESGALPIHAYDQIETLMGQATLGLELEEQAPDLDTLLVAVGGGGLIGGIAAWYGGRVRIVGVEPEQCPTLARALEAGRPVDAPSGGVAADSLAPRQVGEMMFPLAQAYISRVALVPDEAILAAQKALWETVRVLPEPGGGAAFAALLSGVYRPEPGERVGVVVCGGNTTAVKL
ncbi:MAG TPA: threonine/serine dehydratase [Bryobacteraceae bacterium]|nr:threonine/serine dehydratase [Bryobacteraceae bacterium]